MADYTNIKKLLWSEYPIPKKFSIWHGDGVLTLPLENIDDMIEAAVLELRSDLLVYGHTNVTGIRTVLPDTAIAVTSAKMSPAFPFQGNRLVKATFDKNSHVVFVNYYPAVVTYQRMLTNDDVQNLVGDELIYFKVYCLWKMADKELAILKTANMQVDNGTVDLSVLEKFAETRQKMYENMKPEILIYNTKF